jgi:hypothetical protein
MLANCITVHDTEIWGNRLEREREKENDRERERKRKRDTFTFSVVSEARVVI